MKQTQTGPDRLGKRQKRQNPGSKARRYLSGLLRYRLCIPQRVSLQRCAHAGQAVPCRAKLLNSVRMSKRCWKTYTLNRRFQQLAGRRRAQAVLVRWCWAVRFRIRSRWYCTAVPDKHLAREWERVLWHISKGSILPDRIRFESEEFTENAAGSTLNSRPTCLFNFLCLFGRLMRQSLSRLDMLPQTTTRPSKCRATLGRKTLFFILIKLTFSTYSSVF